MKIDLVCGSAKGNDGNVVIMDGYIEGSSVEYIDIVPLMCKFVFIPV